MKKNLREWALSSGWRLPGQKITCDIVNLDETEAKDNIYYKQRWINERGLEQKLIVTYSY